MSDDILGHIPALRAYSRALCRSVPDAEDLVQETLLRAIENAHRYRPGTNMRAWLFTIMRNRFLTNCQKAARERTGAADCASLLAQVRPGQEWHLQATELQAALREMPRHYREAIILVGALGETYLDAARILDCDIGTIKSRVNRARSMLRRVLEPAL
ncbi:sigma-70 family RNA polymerase sigma factor [Paracoccus sp. PS-1]|uniref:sigma-70 family RNA polymerase sigma factor n=1 Tax=unclassified Paracoccus (in: a-proteobacteria) TaxID=2688777 RepID=UPI00048BDA5F|nr:MULTISPECIES: sigma-70 family RNA polymerase sigma factor [unclassified Paracoccus (in: a-proteobacteria)]MDQ7264160.1 sigma-70 family RNA polymerase sigma factor [Paracoccus sp. PS1]RQP07406.1 MAG: sigma-70 family RNA polymerase sigma factor [Paracoccus sp. BP8]UFM64463.1 sigma-70 family RNA polymerase sigma factor [Paracoccus sp. MA]UFM66926.1 sigma-70 family RNA polymerase sigma factor [Paracoccus sp. MA]